MDNKEVLKNIIKTKRKNSYKENKTIEQLRKETEKAGSLIPLPENIKYKSVVAGNVNAEWITCGEINENRIFMFMHGGGYYRGSVAATRATVARISAEAKVKCLSINYRLAPEHPFPAAIDDTYSAYEWLINEGISPEHIIVSGQSAGGGLCLALLLKIKDNNFYQPKGAIALSPWTDLSQTGKTMVTNEKIDPVISKQYLDRFAKLYFPNSYNMSYLASPIIGELSGLPDMLIQVGSAETMLDDSKRFFEKAKKANVNAKLEIWEDMFHGWHSNACLLYTSDAADED